MGREQSKERSFLDLEMRHLPLENVSSRLAFYKAQLTRELRQRGVSFDFHLWVSDEWFCPDGVPGFALPFYLFHPKLMKLQKQQTGLVEGTTDRQILKLMRHELGHAIDNAFGLRKASGREEIFGSSDVEYPESYHPKKYSKGFVHYLGDNYAQSHPDEDFAETFAYWLDPQKKWHAREHSKKVQAKLEWMDQVMGDLQKQKMTLKNKYRIDPIEKNKKTLKEFYEQWREDRGEIGYKRIDQNLKRAFAQSQGQPLKLRMIKKDQRQKWCRKVAEQSQIPHYEAERALKKLMERVERLGITVNSRDLGRKAPSLIEKNYRYLKENHLLKYYL